MKSYQESVDMVLREISSVHRAVVQYNKQIYSNDVVSDTWPIKLGEISSRKDIRNFLNRAALNHNFSGIFRAQLGCLGYSLESKHVTNKVIKEAWDLFIIQQVTDV